MSTTNDNGRPNIELSGMPLYECVTCDRSVSPDETYCQTCLDSGIAEKDRGIHHGY